MANQIDDEKHRIQELISSIEESYGKGKSTSSVVESGISFPEPVKNTEVQKITRNLLLFSATF